jgi:hypothetical protein
VKLQRRGLEVIAWSIINLDDFVLRDPRTLSIAIFVKQQTSTNVNFDPAQIPSIFPPVDKQ